MIGYLEELKGCATAPLDHEERSELQALRKEHEKLKKMLEATETKPAKKAKSDKSDSDSEEVTYFALIVSGRRYGFLAPSLQHGKVEGSRG